MIFWYLCLALLFSLDLQSIPIKTPEIPELNKFAIAIPSGWGYRTFRGDNGLIGALWPKGTTFNNCDTAVFIFAQDFTKPMPKIPENAHLFKEKCPKSGFKLAKPEDDADATKSISEKYFDGLCGRTEILFEERIKDIRIIVVLASSKYVPRSLFKDVQNIVKSYRREVEKSFEDFAPEMSNNNQTQEYD